MKHSFGVPVKSLQRSSWVLQTAPLFRRPVLGFVRGRLIVCAGEIDPSSPHSGIQYGDTPIYSNPPSLFGTSPGTMLTIGTHRARGKIRLGGRRRQEAAGSALAEWGEVFRSGRSGSSCC